MQKRFLTLLFVAFVFQLNAQTVKLEGIVKNPSDSIITFTRSSTPVLSLNQDNKTYIAKLDKKGRFNISLPESSINEWMLAQGDEEAYFYLRTGQEIFLTVDFEGEYFVRAKGKFADEVNYLEHEESELTKIDNSKTDSLKQTQKSFAEDFKSQQEIAAIQQGILDKYQTKFKISNDFYKWLTAHYKYYPAKNISIERRNSMNDESMALLVGDGFNDDYAALNSSSYLQLAESYVNYKLIGTKNKIFVGEYLDFVLKSNQLNAKTKDVLLAGSLLTISSAPDTIYKAFDKFRAEIKDTSLLNMLTNQRNYFIRFIDEAKYSSEDIIQAKSLKEIFNKFKGKIIYIDFWASWCGPCKQAMPYAATLKEKLKDKNIVFLYLAFNDQKINWLAARDELGIEGEHVLLSSDLIKEASEIFKVSAIPHYAIISKYGEIIDPKAKGPQEVYDQLSKLAN